MGVRGCGDEGFGVALLVTEPIGLVDVCRVGSLHGDEGSAMLSSGL